MTILSIIAAIANNRVIGRGNQLPWRLSEDLAFFKRTTLGAPVIMGRKTYESIGRPLPGRRNFVITRNPTRVFNGCETAVSLTDALACCTAAGAPEAFLIGGAQLYAQGLAHANKLIITEIQHDFEGDTTFPVIDSADWKEVSRETHHSTSPNNFEYAFVIYRRVPNTSSKLPI